VINQAKKRILIGAPAYDRRNDVAFTFSYGETVRLGCQRGVDVRGLWPIGKVIPEARNDLIREALKFNFDHLVCIDCDQDWEPEWVFELCDYPVDVVGAPVRRKTDDSVLYNVKSMGGPNSIYVDTATGLHTSDDMALGCGMLAISNKAMKALWDTSEPYTVALSNDEPGRWMCETHPVDNGGDLKELMGEDIFLCEKLRALGFRTHVAAHMNPGHIGFKRWQGDFAKDLESMQKSVAA
jgi:hypothetical protein